MQVDQLKEAGIQKVVCLAVAEPEQVSEWAHKVGLSDSKIETWADTKGAWTRMLGLDENQFDAPGPRSQRSGTVCEYSHIAVLLYMEGRKSNDDLFAMLQICWVDR